MSKKLLEAVEMLHVEQQKSVRLRLMLMVVATDLGSLYTATSKAESSPLIRGWSTRKIL